MSDASAQQDTDIPLEVVSDVEYDRADKIRGLLNTYLVVPGRIVLSDYRAIIGATIVALYVLMGTVGVWLMEPTELWAGARLEAPFQSWAHPLGTDPQGRDMFKLIAFGTTPILQIVLAGAVFSTTVATVFGLTSGFVGGRVDQIISTITDVAITIPGLPLVIVLAVTIKPQHPLAIGVLLTINSWGGLARNIRSQVLSIREEEYVEISKAMGISTSSTILKDIMPNMMPYILYNFMSSARGVIFSSVGLYYLGVLPYTQENWGVLLQQAYTGGALTSWAMFHWILWPILAVVLFSIGLILISQSTDKLFNPRVRARHEGAEDGDASPEELTG